MAIPNIALRTQDPLAGTPYRTLAILGQSHGTYVLEARDPGGKRCAVKLLRDTYTSEDAYRLEQEIQALNAIDHPHLVRILATGQTPDGRLYFVMPRLRGETVRRRLDRLGPIAPVAAARLLAGMLTGLDAAHQAGVIHRDIKPANLFLHARGKLISIHPEERRAVVTQSPERCVLIDFGIAKLTAARAALTTDSHLIGTPRYLAPEQILSGRIDARTDVYAAGLTLFEMITGHNPLPCPDSRSGIRARLDATPPRLGQFVSVPPALEHAIRRALDPNPARRWPSARAFAAVLEHALDPQHAQGAAR